MMDGTGGTHLLTGWQSVVGVWSEGMGRICLSGTLVLICALLLMRLLRRAQPGVRCWIGRFAFLKLYLLWLCFATIALPVLPNKSDPDPAKSVFQAGVNSAGRNDRTVTMPLFAYNQSADRAAGPIPSASPRKEGVLGNMPQMLSCLWGIGVLLGLLRIVRQYREATALVRSACPITDAAIQAEFIHVKNVLGLRCNPVLAVSDLTDVPMLFGLFRPTVVLPSAIVTDLVPDACRMILAHELAHVKRHDLSWSFLTGLALVPFFFHPLVWWAHRELRIVQEICCDEQAIRRVAVSTHAYGEVLVQVAASQTSAARDELISVAMAESFTTIQRRLEEMQTFRVNTGWKRRAPAIAAIVGGVALLPWQLAAQTHTQPGSQASAQPKPQKPVQSAEPEQQLEFYRIIKVGNYNLKIADGESIWASKASPEEKERTRAYRLRTADKSDSGTIGDEHLVRPNLDLRLDIDGRNQEDAMLVQGVCDVQSKDDHGRALLSQNAPFRAERAFARPEQEARRRATLALRKEADARSLRTLEGKFVVVNGVVRTLEFAGDDLHPGASKRLGQVSATIDTIQQSGGKVVVYITCIAGQFEPRDPRGLQEDLERSMFGTRAIQAEFVGTDGVVYKNSGGGGSTTTERPLTVGPDGGVHRDSNVAGISTVTSQLSFSFPPIPEGVRPQKIILRVVEQQGENFRVPFKFTDIPLADPI